MRESKYKSAKYIFIAVMGVLLAALVMAPANAAFEKQYSVFSALKSPPEGFSLIVEPNVLLLIDTSGSMTFQMDNDNSTYGDGTKPYKNWTYYGKDKNPGTSTTGTNNIVSDDNHDYHPLLRYIPDNLLPNNTSYFSYDVVTETVTTKEKTKNGAFLSGTDYRLANGEWVDSGGVFPSTQNDGRLIRYYKQGILNPIYIAVGKDENKPNAPADCEWVWENSAWYLYKTVQTTVERKKYKYPNDSRMYILKNVLYRILGDTSLVGDMRMALSGYSQTYNSSGRGSDWYQWTPLTHNSPSAGSGVNITWKSDKKDQAKLHVDFGSTTKTENHLKKIREWFDGTETSDNEEFRADGGTPLAASIYNSSSNSAYHFIKDAIEYWCQDNWLVVLTDGADDAFSSNPNKGPAAVKSLYDKKITAMDKMTAKPIKTMVIGMINPDQQMNLAKALAKMADYGDDGELRTDAYDNAGKWKLPIEESKAYFATDLDKLMEAFSTIFRTIQDVAATGSAPLVNPPKSFDSSGKVYSTGFKPSSTRQWTGFLTSYKISDNNVVIDPADSDYWEAGAKLNARTVASRNIYTADWDESSGSSGVSGTNLKNFVDSNSSSLRKLAARDLTISDVSDAEFKKFINWVRGDDPWKESEGGKRWKLGDPFHVGLVEVGAPQSLLTDPAYRDFKEGAAKDRTSIVYMHANDGMVHAFDSATGEEKWAFIPPNVLNYPRLIGTKVDGGKWVADDKLSYPRYLLDGPLVAEDVALDDDGTTYRTVLLGTLGRAGAGMYAMDITEPEKPQFLWALDNNCYDGSGILRSENQTYLKWDGKKSGGVSSSLDAYQSSSSSAAGNLRLTVSTPFIGTVELDSGTRWIALTGAGARMFPSSDDEGGRAVVALNMKDGALLKEIVHSDLGAVVAPISVEAGPRAMRIRKFFLGDENGSIFEGDLSPESTDQWSLTKVFAPDAASGSGGLYSIPFGIEIAMIKNQKWLFWGTGNTDWIFGDDEGKCYIFSMNRSMAADSSFNLNDLPPLQNIAGDEYDDTVAVSSKGWRMELKPGEMVSTPPVFYKGYIFFATYIPVGGDPCSVGDSELYIMKADTGLGGFVTYGAGGVADSWNKSVKLEATRISGITISEGKVYVGFTAFSTASNPKEVLKPYTGDVTISDNLLVFESPAPDESDDDGKSGVARPAYWRDWRP